MGIATVIAILLALPSLFDGGSASRTDSVVIGGSAGISSDARKDGGRKRERNRDDRDGSKRRDRDGREGAAEPATPDSAPAPTLEGLPGAAPAAPEPVPPDPGPAIPPAASPAPDDGVEDDDGGEYEDDGSTDD